MKELITKDVVTGVVTESFGIIDCKMMVRFYEPRINDRKHTVRSTYEFFVIINEDVEDPLTQEISNVASPYSLKKITKNYLLSELNSDNLMESIAKVGLTHSYGLSFDDWK